MSLALRTPVGANHENSTGSFNGSTLESHQSAFLH